MDPGTGGDEVRGSDERYRLALEAAGHVYFEFDPRSRRTVAGAPWTALGYGVDEVSPSFDAWLALVHPDDRGPLLDGIARQHHGPAETHRVEYRMRAKDGTWRSVLVSTRALARDPDGVPLRTVGTITDVTEARAARDRAALSDRLASLGALAAGIAHAVNNPLASMSSGLEVLREGLAGAEGDPPQVRARLAELRLAADDAAQGAARVRDVVRALQLFSSPREGRGGVADVRAELAAALELTRNALSHRARLRVDVPPALPPVAAAPGELGHAFVSLLSTVAAALPEGRAAEQEVRVVARAAGGQVVVEVHGAGDALPPEIVAPADGTMPGAEEPRLAVCRGVVAAAGGALSIDRAAGGDVTVRVTLPARRGAAAPAVATVSAPPPRGRVLVIDDDALVGRSLARLLQGAHDVTVLTSPAEAIARIEGGERWDAILCDLMMPELSGMDVEARISAAAPELVSRIIYLTGGAFTDAARQFLAAGRPFLDKPVDSQELRERVAAVVRRP